MPMKKPTPETDRPYDAEPIYTDPMNPEAEMNVNLRMPPPEVEVEPVVPGRVTAVKSLDPKSFDVVEEQPNLVPVQTPEEIVAIEKGAVRYYNPNPPQKLTPEDIANRLMADGLAAREKEAQESAIKAAAELKKQEKKDKEEKPE